MFTAGAEQDLRSPDWCVRNLDRKILHSLSGSLPAREKLSARHQTCCDYMSFSFSVWCCCCGGGGGGGGGGGTNFTHGEPCREQNLDFVLISKNRDLPRPFKDFAPGQATCAAAFANYTTAIGFSSCF